MKFTELKTRNGMIRLLMWPIMLGFVGSVMSVGARPLSVLFATGPDTHGYGMHDHNPSTAVLSDSL